MLSPVSLFRSTKSEKILGLREGYHNSQPTSPTPPPGNNRLPMSPLNTARGQHYYSAGVTASSAATSGRPANKDDECKTKKTFHNSRIESEKRFSSGHGSSLSLVSSSSSLYSSQEEKHAAEVRKLKRDLSDAQDRVTTLTNQLTTNVMIDK